MPEIPDIHDLVRTDYKAVDKRDGLHSVMGWIKGDSDKVPIITDGGKPFGIVNDRALMGRKLNHNAHVEQFTLSTRALPHSATLDDAMARMAEFRAPHLPVEEKGKLLGYVSAIDLVRESGVECTARDVCVPVTNLRENQTLGEALHLFSQEYVDHLPVLDAQGRPRGILSRRRLLQLEADYADSRGRKDAGGNPVTFLDNPVQGFTDNAITLRPDADAEAVLEALESWGYALVEDKAGHLVGIVTPETLARTLPQETHRRNTV